MKLALTMKALVFGIILMSSNAFAASSQACNDWLIEYNTATGSLSELIANVKAQTSTEIPSLTFRQIGKYTYAASYIPTQGVDQKSEKAQVIKVLKYIQSAGYSVTCDPSTVQ